MFDQESANSFPGNFELHFHIDLKNFIFISFFIIFQQNLCWLSVTITNRKVLQHCDPYDVRVQEQTLMMFCFIISIFSSTRHFDVLRNPYSKGTKPLSQNRDTDYSVFYQQRSDLVKGWVVILLTSLGTFSFWSHFLNFRDFQLL